MNYKCFALNFINISYTNYHNFLVYGDEFSCIFFVKYETEKNLISNLESWKNTTVCSILVEQNGYKLSDIL